MKISTNYQLNCGSAKQQNLQKCGKPAFQANLLPKIEESLIMEAKKSGMLAKLNEQFKNIKNWGSRKSFINQAIDLDTGKTSLCLENYQVSRNYAGDLGVDENTGLLKQFLSLTEDNVLKAEKNVQDLASQNKTEAIIKIASNPKYLKEITGEANPSDEKLAAAIENLTEDQLIDYRFGLKESLLETSKLLDFDIFA